MKSKVIGVILSLSPLTAIAESSNNVDISATAAVALIIGVFALSRNKEKAE
tara:strand:- start:8705 stop:8857 length:153 start_codon:yes stop_codon:yes gene_type:complete